MFVNYLKIAFRNLVRYRGFSFINISGLAIGMACTILILMWVLDELSYDRFHKNADQIFRVVFADETYDKIYHYSVTPPALAAVLKNDFPEVNQVVRFKSLENILLSYGLNKFKTTVGFTDPDIFEMFTLPCLSGEPGTSLKNPNSAVLTASMALKIFGEDNPIGKTIKLDNQTICIITGIIEDLPANSTLNFDLLIPFQHLKDLTANLTTEGWDQFAYQTFVLLLPGTQVSEFNKKIANLLMQLADLSWKPRLYLQSFTAIHLHDLNGGGGIVYIYIFSVIAAFILLIACVNFMNLTTARSAIRNKEIALRKVMGASKTKLIQQFYGESILIAVISFLFSILLVELFLPLFNELCAKTLNLSLTTNLYLLPFLAGIAFCTGIISGSYPALFLSSLRPVNSLKGLSVSSAARFRKILVVLQFILSIILIMATLVVANQLNYIQKQNLGFEKEHVLYLPFSRELRSNFENFKNELSQNPQIVSITATSSKVGIGNVASTDLNQWEGNNGDQAILLYMLAADHDFLQTFNIELAAGRYFSGDFIGDSESVVLNETAVREMGLEDPIGKKILDHYRIVGIIKDFNFESLHARIKPLGLFLVPEWFDYLAIKIKSDDIPATLHYLKIIQEKFSPDFLFEYQFLDEAFDKLYRSEQRLGKIFNYFSFLAIIISGLGLFGLTSFMIERRVKEIGIRKVIGASITNIITLIITEFLKWILIANLIAWPIAWYILNYWLQNFAYRISIHWWIFGIAGSLTMMIALLTVSWQAIRAATANPINSLRYE